MQFSFRLPSFCPPLDQRIMMRANDPRTTIVEMGQRYGEGHKISTQPLFTYQVFNCNVVTLFAGNLAGMSHYPGMVMSPKSYLPRFIDEVSSQAGTNDISAVPVSGDDFFHDDIRTILMDRGIKIIGDFCDDFDTAVRPEFQSAFFYRVQHGYEPSGYAGITAQLGEKFVLATPETREVLLYCAATSIGNLTLTPKKDSLVK